MIPEKLATKHSKILTVGFDKKYTWSLNYICRGVLQYHQANSGKGLQLDRSLFYILLTFIGPCIITYEFLNVTNEMQLLRLIGYIK
jgi:hypothetical protein